MFGGGAAAGCAGSTAMVREGGVRFRYLGFEGDSKGNGGRNGGKGRGGGEELVGIP